MFRRRRMIIRRGFRAPGEGDGPVWRWLLGMVIVQCLTRSALAQRTYTWQEIRDKFPAGNPNLPAGQINVNESRAQEITAYLRPNPDFTMATDGTQLTPYQGVWRPFPGTQFSQHDYFLTTRGLKRELRRDSARGATAIAGSTLDDQERTLMFTLRNAFVQTLQAKAV